jgi:hypothetical protein
MPGDHPTDRHQYHQIYRTALIRLASMKASRSTLRNLTERPTFIAASCRLAAWCWRQYEKQLAERAETRSGTAGNPAHSEVLEVSKHGALDHRESRGSKSLATVPEPREGGRIMVPGLQIAANPQGEGKIPSLNESILRVCSNCSLSLVCPEFVAGGLLRVQDPGLDANDRRTSGVGVHACRAADAAGHDASDGRRNVRRSPGRRSVGGGGPDEQASAPGQGAEACSCLGPTRGHRSQIFLAH